MFFNPLILLLDEPYYPIMGIFVSLMVFNLYQFMSRSSSETSSPQQTTQSQSATPNPTQADQSPLTPPNSLPLRSYSGRALLANPVGYLTLLVYPEEVDYDQLYRIDQLARSSRYAVETDPDQDEYIIFTIPEHHYSHVINWPLISDLNIEILEDEISNRRPKFSSIPSEFYASDYSTEEGSFSATEDDSVEDDKMYSSTDNSFSEDIDY